MRYEDLTPWEKALVDAAYSAGYGDGSSDESASANECTPTSWRDNDEITAQALANCPEGRT